MSRDDSARGLTVPRRPTCEHFLYVFKAARRAARAAASAPWPSLPLALPLRPGPTPVGWREKRRYLGPQLTEKFQGRVGI